ncbi:inward rectifier potassium channel 16 [Megalops cyprinoides]|uniref:inward rectifier potassium channel 16 n=1 Tax=Megalops cyprinoides TaxID=118141 RepID=UPI0018642F1C|nr:inward rectifier potassium channel 16 [Megalops cyprinoides]
MSSKAVQYTTVRSRALSVSIEVGQGNRKRHCVQKDGSCNVTFRHAPGEWGLYVTDIFTTLVEIRWRAMLLIFSLSYILSWLFFGLLFWVIALAHGDIQDPATEPCVDNVRSFTAAFLFSLETQTTIGYGFRGMTENCMVAIVVVTVQDVLSCFIDTIVIGIAVAKMASARKRAQTVGFSSCAVIGMRDGQMCLSWRVGDFRRNHIVEGTARAQLVRHTMYPTGRIAVSYRDLDLEHSDIILATPTTITHRIQRGSPLYGMSLKDLRNEDFELVVSFTYTGDSTGMLHQTRTSYTPADIRWGHGFQEMLRVKSRHYRVDYALFHNTVKMPAPVGSSEEQDRRKQSVQAPGDKPQTAVALLANGQALEAPGPSGGVGDREDKP